MIEKMKGEAKSFPKDKKQAEQFTLQLIKIIHEDEELKKILQQQASSQAPPSTVVGGIAAQLLTLLFMKLREQIQGSRVNSKFVIQIIRVAIKEITALAQAVGMRMSVEDERAAAKIAGDALDGAMRGKGPQAPQGQGGLQQAPQGMLQGGM